MSELILNNLQTFKTQLVTNPTRTFKLEVRTLMPGGSDESVDSEPELSSVAVLGHKRANPSAKSECYRVAKAWKLKIVVPHDYVEKIMDLLAEIPRAKHQNIDLVFLTAQFDATNIANSNATFDVAVEGFAELNVAVGGFAEL